MTFEELNLIPPIQRAVAEKGYTEPTPIQQQAIPPALAGRDLMGCAQTGTGKTAAFTLPILQQLAAQPAHGRRPIRALVITPTRELAIQIDECCRDYARYTQLRHAVIFGGVGQRPQVAALQKGVDLLVATPGRLLDLIAQGYISLSGIRHFVLDEADRMLDMGFIHDIRRILPLLPAERQTLFFSATMPDDIVRLASGMLRDPARISVTPPASVVETIRQRIVYAEKAEKKERLVELLRECGEESVLVFSRTKHGADRIARILTKAGIEARAIHGDKSQGAREKAMGDFRSGACRVLIATDIAARGIDVSELPLVVNYDLPEVAETYVHRIGRTGRAGCEGTAVSFCSEEERELLRDILRLTGLVLDEDRATGEIRLEMPQYTQARNESSTQQAQRQKQGQGRQPASQQAQRQKQGQGRQPATQQAQRQKQGQGRQPATQQAPRQKQGQGRQPQQPQPAIRRARGTDSPGAQKQGTAEARVQASGTPERRRSRRRRSSAAR